MLFTRWFGRRPRAPRAFRPAVLLLEDRTVPSRFAAPGPATHLQVIVPANVRAGQTFDVLVKAEDASNRVATGYVGTISLSSGDATATGTATYGSTLTALPLTYQFTSGDRGVHEFRVQLTTVGSETITAADAANAFTNTATTNVVPAPVATTLVVRTPGQAATGVPTPVTVEVLDQSGHALRNFTGAVTVSSADTSATGSPGRHTAAASLPITYTFTVRDRGTHTFLVTFNLAAATTGTATTVTASTSTPALTGQGSVTVYPPTVATHLGVLALPVAFSGTAAPVLVVALNASNRVVSGYTGTVGFTSSDTAATVSATRGGTATALSGFTYQFTSSDAGKHVFWFRFGATGRQTLTATDAGTSSLTGTANVRVLAALSLPWLHGWAL